ncbi:MAG TPA: 16S rRNA (adenine(1518)-N(6)/adenine(1519)-N(6))-dimethyltransferase RsmA [Candidatus Didemnitutus sp.]|nr:16S rRNA (adenine(1518)-N(6)/adenine(1519)-N(6))-dimethyltransferase RsmA [Candidatus Didemnitutus sp.]
MPLSPSATRDLLAQLAHTPKRYLGQNFLVDGNIVRKSLELAGVGPGDTIVEVGPGLGTLTTALLEAGAEVWTIETDRNLHAHLTTTLAPRFPALHLMLGDGVEHPLAGLPADRAPTAKVVANLPYAISTPWMDAVLSSPLPQRMVLMLQQEASERYTAEPGSKQFGAISIFLQAAYAPERGHPVAAACFHPRPDVDSVLLNLARLPAPFVFSAQVKQVIRACFQQRRKQIGSLLRGKLADGGAAFCALLPSAGLDSRARPEDIPVQLWRQMAV